VETQYPETESPRTGHRTPAPRTATLRVPAPRTTAPGSTAPRTPWRGPIDVSGVAGFATGHADPDDLRRVVTAAPGYARASDEERDALLDVLLRVGTTPVPAAAPPLRRRWWRRARSMR
jgi:hypothetical protein